MREMSGNKLGERNDTDSRRCPGDGLQHRMVIYILSWRMVAIPSSAVYPCWVICGSFVAATPGPCNDIRADLKRRPIFVATRD